MLSGLCAKMGASNGKEAFRTAVLDLVNNQQSITTQDDSFWDRYWADTSLTAYDYFALISAVDIRNLRDKASGNLTALCFKVVERISAATATACSGPNEHVIVLNCVRLLTRVLPFLFEAPDWRLLFWSPANFMETEEGEQPQALAQVLLNSLADLLFCPDLTVLPKVKQGPENPDDLSSLDSCEYIWEAGIGCLASPGTTKQMDLNRAEIIRLLITCFSEALYLDPSELDQANRWLAHFTSPENRHVLPLLTSLLNVICSYDPVGYGVPYYYALVQDPRGELVETASHLLILLLDYTLPSSRQQATPIARPSMQQRGGAIQVPVMSEPGMANLFCGFVSRLHQNEDLELLAKGLMGLLCNPLKQTYLPNSVKKIYFTQELYILVWKLFELNKKFLVYVLRSPHLFDLLVPLLHQLLETRTNPALVGMLHLGIFIMLLLSGERNFGVRLNKPYVQKFQLPDIPKFSGSHADLLFLVFHKIITSGLPRLQPLYDCLLTIMVNISPYLKTLSMVTCARLMHLMESFSTPWFLFAKPNNHYLVFYLLEIFNNIVQYQFDGNTSLIYSIIRSKVVFYQLANLPEDSYMLLSPRTQTNLPTLPAPVDPKATKEADGDSNSKKPAVPAKNSEQTKLPLHEGTPSDGSKFNQTPKDGTHVAEIEPPKKIETVEVEVEVATGETEGEGKGEEDDGQGDGDGDERRRGEQEEEQGEKGGTERAGELEGGEGEGGTEERREREEGGEQDASQKDLETEERTSQTVPTSSITFPSHVSMSPSPLPPSSASKQLLQRQRKAAKKRPTPAAMALKSSSSLPPHVSSDQQKSLLSLHRDVGQKNTHLMEPQTPEFKPSPEWVRSWKQKLPLHTVLRVLQVLVPQVEKLCTENNVKSEQEILAYLKNGTLVGLLPVPHPILIRKYQTSESTEMWLHSYVWGVVYVRSYNPPVWYDTRIKLFHVHKQDGTTEEEID